MSHEYDTGTSRSWKNRVMDVRLCLCGAIEYLKAVRAALTGHPLRLLNMENPHHNPHPMLPLTLYLPLHLACSLQQPLLSFQPLPKLLTRHNLLLYLTLLAHTHLSLSNIIDRAGHGCLHHISLMMCSSPKLTSTTILKLTVPQTVMRHDQTLPLQNAFIHHLIA